MAPIERTAEHISLGKGYNKKIFLPQYSLSHLLAYIFKILKKISRKYFHRIRKDFCFCILDQICFCSNKSVCRSFEALVFHKKILIEREGDSVHLLVSLISNNFSDDPAPKDGA